MYLLTGTPPLSNPPIPGGKFGENPRLGISSKISVFCNFNCAIESKSLEIENLDSLFVRAHFCATPRSKFDDPPIFGRSQNFGPDDGGIQNSGEIRDFAAIRKFRQFRA